MENLKIRVNNEAESKEAQELFFELGYMVVNNMDCEKGYIVASKNAESPINFDYWHNVKNIVTIPELRAMVASQHSNDEPFLTPECTLNDQYAEIEQVRQAIKVKSGSDSDHALDAMSFGLMGVGEVKRHNHYFKDVSGLNEIDVYMVLKLFNVTDPCLQHIAKKALCAGQRGHKDFKKDLQDILDTAKRAVEINNG